MIRAKSGESLTENTTIRLSSPPTVSRRVEMLNLVIGSTHHLVVNATGTPAPHYQWRKNGVNIPGETSSVYSMSPVGWDDLGT